MCVVVLNYYLKLNLQVALSVRGFGAQQFIRSSRKQGLVHISTKAEKVR